ncbi:Sodium channel modifier 1 [Holothuria leucospilota]|uniref:Sodium channel modifier 1 n=1 Tax=Holothuria leucospilota TaxID=206669 RepID=A0A9Q1HJ73_HOLLE|nr:Sodium channel modifier 1 [Holothuria leucospilota]
MSFKREGDDFSELNIIKKRRVEELLSRDIPDDEAHLMKNGRFACLVCSHQPVLDTVEMLCVHRDGKRHKQCAEHFFRKKREFHQLVEKRRHELSLHGNSADSSKNTQAPLLMRAQAASKNALLRYAPYNPISSGAQSGQNSATEDFKTKRSKTKGFFEYTRNYLTNNVPARYGRVETDVTPQSRKQPSIAEKSCQSLFKPNKVIVNSENKVCASPAAEVTVRPYISKRMRKGQANGVNIQEKQTSGTTFSVNQAASNIESDRKKDIIQLDEGDDTWESISQFPPVEECKVLETDSQEESCRYQSERDDYVYTHDSSSHSVALERSCTRVNTGSASHKAKGTICESKVEGSIHDEDATNYSRTNEDKSCLSIEGSRYDSHEFKRFQTRSFLGERNSRQTSSLEKVTFPTRNVPQRAERCEETFVKRTNSGITEEQNRNNGENRTCLQQSFTDCVQGALQQSDMGFPTTLAHQGEATNAKNYHADENIRSFKSKPPDSNAMKMKVQQPVKFKIGMSQREKSFLNQGVSSEGVSHAESESKANISKNVHHKEKMKGNTVSKPPSKYSEERKQELQRHLELTSSGWVRDPAGRWVKDEDVEFDSDEEEPV